MLKDHLLLGLSSLVEGVYMGDKNEII